MRCTRKSVFYDVQLTPGMPLARSPHSLRLLLPRHGQEAPQRCTHVNASYAPKYHQACPWLALLVLTASCYYLMARKSPMRCTMTGGQRRMRDSQSGSVYLAQPTWRAGTHNVCTQLFRLVRQA